MKRWVVTNRFFSKPLITQKRICAWCHRKQSFTYSFLHILFILFKKRNAKPHQKKKRKTTFKKRNAKPHIGDTHAIDCRCPGPLTCDLSFLQERLRSPLTDCAKFRYSQTYHTAIKIIFPMSPICGFAFLFLNVFLRFFFWRVYIDT